MISLYTETLKTQSKDLQTEKHEEIKNICESELLSCVRLLETPWTAASQAPPSMGFSRQEYQSGLPFPSPGDLANPGIEPESPTLQVDTLPSKPPGKPYKKNFLVYSKLI